MKTVEQCGTFLEFRMDVLKVSQAVAARRCGKWQADIWKLEQGKLPFPWKRDAYLKGLNLTEDQLERLVRGSAAERALKTPIEKDCLFATATASKPAEVSRLVERLEARTEAKRA